MESSGLEMVERSLSSTMFSFRKCKEMKTIVTVCCHHYDDARVETYFVNGVSVL